MTTTYHGAQVEIHGVKADIEALVLTGTLAGVRVFADNGEAGWWDGSNLHWLATGTGGSGDVIQDGSVTPGNLAVWSADHEIEDGGPVPTGTGGSGGMDYICIEDQKAQNTPAGTFTTGAWRTRDLNTEVSDTGNHASVASNQITLAAGTYVCHISCPAWQVATHQAMLYDTTAAAVILNGTSEFTATADSVQTRSIVVGKFVLSVQSVLEVRHRCGTTANDHGFGILNNFTTEVYTIAEFWKVA